MTIRILLVFLVSFSANAEEALKPDDLPALVRDRNDNAVASRLAGQGAAARTGHLTRSFLPKISLRAGSESAEVGSAPRQEKGFWSAEARVNVFSGGRDRIEEDILQSRARSGRVQAEKDFQSELKAARKIFWNLAAIQQMIAETREAIEKNEENIKGARTRAGAGVTTAADAVHFELEKTLLVKNLKRLEHEDDVLKSKLSVLIGFADHKKLKIQNTFPHPPEAEFQEREISSENNLDVSLVRQNEAIDRMKSRQAGRWYVPKVDVYARYSQPSLSEDYTLAIRKETETITGVSLTLDLGQALNDRTTSQAQDFEARAQTARARQLAKTIQSESHELQHDLRMLHELLHDADRDVDKAQSFLKLTRSEYARGVKNGPDLLEAFLKFYEFRKRKIELNLEYQLAKAELEALSSTAGD